jgi:hypothetical protein
MNWLLQDFGKRVRFTPENPLYTLSSLFDELTLADEQFLGSITGVPFRQIRGFLKEPFQDDSFFPRLQSARAALQTQKIYSADLYAKKNPPAICGSSGMSAEDHSRDGRSEWYLLRLHSARTPS